MRLKDYYRTLGVPPSATADEIRKSFRRLAMQYHPDRNEDSPFAAGHFRELKEAYSTLGDPLKRGRYDEERWLSGMSRQASFTSVTPQSLLAEARKLQQHMERIDTYRMSHKALQEYVLLLLSDEHLAVLKGSPEQADLVRSVLGSVNKLKESLWPQVVDRLQLLAVGAPSLQAMIDAAWRLRKRQEVEAKVFPWVLAGVVLLLVLLFVCFIL